MNIFYLDKNSRKAAIAHCNSHVVKMLLEYAQIMSTVHRHFGNEDERLYKATHKNHPSVIWAREGSDNYCYLHNLFVHLHNEYRYRFGMDKTHASFERCNPVLRYLPKGMPPGSTPVRLAMPLQYHNPDPVKAYRAYYTNEKSHLLSYTRTPPPKWLKEFSDVS